VVARAGVAVLAVLLVGWLAVQERDTRLHAAGAAVLRGGGSAAALARAEDDLRRARLLSRDTRPDLDRALVLRAQGKRAEAATLARSVVEREPDNLTGWGILGVLSRGRDAATERKALAELRRLDPVSARAAGIR
jgi:hypothetical protein